MQSRRFLGLALVGAGLVSLLAFLPVAPSRAQETKAGGASALDGLPADTSLVVRIRNVDDLERKFKASPFYGLRDHPEIVKFVEEMRRRIQEGLAEARTKLGFDPMELLEMCDGEVVFAVGALDKVLAAATAGFSGGDANVSPGDLPLILVVDAGASAPKLRERLAKIFEFAQKDGARKEVDQFRGGSITTLSDGKAGADKDAKNGKAVGAPESGGLEKIYFGDLGSRIFLSINRPFLEQAMANLTAPPADALTKSADYAATQREIRGESDFTFFVNIRPIANSARKALQANPIAAMVWTMVEGKILGRSLKNLGVSLTLRENDMQQVLFINNAGGSDGLLGILKGQPLPGRPSPMIPEDVDSFNSMSINFQSLYTIAIDIANQAMMMMGGAPPGANGQPGNAEQFVEQALGIKLKPVVDALGNAFHLYQRGAPTPDNPFGNATFALELKDEMPFKELLAKLAASMGNQEPQKYLDRDIYQFGGAEDGPAVALSDKFLVIGAKTEAVKEVIRRSGKGGKGIGDAPGYQALAALVPNQVQALNYASAQSFRETLQMMKDAFAIAADDVPVPDMTIFADVLAGSIGFSAWKEQGYYGEGTVVFRKGRPVTPSGKPAPAKDAKADSKK